MSAIYKNIGETIRNYRKSKNYSTAELAERLNVSAGFINNLENARNDVFKIELLNSIMKELDIPLEEFFKLEPINMRWLYVDTKHKSLQVHKVDNDSKEDLYILNKNLNSVVRSFLATIDEYGCKKEAIEEITKSTNSHLEAMRSLKKLSNY